jgi:hypothetical protein
MDEKFLVLLSLSALILLCTLIDALRFDNSCLYEEGVASIV